MRALLTGCPDVALAAIVHTLALPVFYDGGDDTVLAIRASLPYLNAVGIDDSPATQRTAEHHTAWAGQLPQEQDALWDWLLAHPTDTLLALLAHCTACAIRPERGAALAAAVPLDVKEWWQPSASYFTRIPKPLILAVVTEAKDGATADNIATLKKGEMAVKAAELLTGTGWLPAMLRAA